MLNLYKVSLGEPVDYAAEELKKYFRMMMPEGGAVNIHYDPAATEGFRLGLLSDLGISVPEGCDPELDDTVYVKTDSKGGIIGGANPGAVLIAVYEFLRKNGCEWIAPGVDGEIVPVAELKPVDYVHTPSMRIRANCIEGAVSQQIVEDFIDYMPKIGLNTFMIQFHNPYEFYQRYYNHIRNLDNHTAEGITYENTIQWTRRLECQMDRRGIKLHACGHGWNNEAFGLDASIGWIEVDDSELPEENRECVAMLGGERRFYRNRPTNTQFCMSNPRAQRRFVNAIADYVERHSNVQYTHVWLADDKNNHCECPECSKHRPSDLYVACMNLLDEELTARGLDNKIVFSVYVDTFWGPLENKIKNPDRFTIMFAPITRDYTKTLSSESSEAKLYPYVRNNITIPASLDESLAYLNSWRPAFDGSRFTFEYHFWKHQHYDLSGQEIARRIYEDTKVYLSEGIDGIMQCGSQRNFFPNGFAHYVHARAQYDASVSYEDLERDFYSAAYGSRWEIFRDMLKRLSDAVPYEFLATPKAVERPRCYYYPEMKPKFDELINIADELVALVAENRFSPVRAHTVSVRLLEKYADYIKHLAVAFGHKVLGEDHEAMKEYERLEAALGGYEAEIGAYFEQCHKCGFIYHALLAKPSTEINIANG